MNEVLISFSFRMGKSPTNKETQKTAPRKRLNLSKLNSNRGFEMMKLAAPLLNKKSVRNITPKKAKRKKMVFCHLLLTV